HAFRQRIKSPVELALGAVRPVAAGMLPQSVLISKLEAMGQDLFAPPNVKGWYGAQAWLNTSTILTRQNFGQAVAMGTVWNNVPTSGPGRFEAVEEAVEGDDSAPAPEPATPGIAVKPATRPSRPEEPAPKTEFDPA